MNSEWKYVRNQLAFVILIALLCCVFLAAGLMIGYSLIGEGKNPLSILSWDKWQLLIDKFTGK